MMLETEILQLLLQSVVTVIFWYGDRGDVAEIYRQSSFAVPRKGEEITLIHAKIDGDHQIVDARVANVQWEFKQPGVIYAHISLERLRIR